MERFLIAGASGGIGKAVAERLIARGKKVVVHGRDQEKLDRAFGDTPKFAADLTIPRAAEGLIADARDALGGLDCVVHSVGIGLIKPALEISDAEFSRILNVNTRTTFLLAQAACRVMAEQKKGMFITVPGILGRSVMKNASAYIASKFAVSGMMKAMALEFQRVGIRFCQFYFGGVDTPFWDQLGMNVMRQRMIPATVAADMIVSAIEAPEHLVMNELVLQPEDHQLG